MGTAKGRQLVLLNILEKDKRMLNHDNTNLVQKWTSLDAKTLLEPLSCYNTFYYNIIKGNQSKYES